MNARDKSNTKGPNPSGLCMCGCGEAAPIARQSVIPLGIVRGMPLRYVRGHYQQRTQQRYRVEDRGYAGGPCWIWQRYINDQGYGVVRHAGGTARAHREVYEEFVGPIPDGLELDHLCRVRSCVNPAHLEPVTRAENTRRNDSPSSVAVREKRCKRGHDLSLPDAMYLVEKTGKYRCRECQRMRNAGCISVEIQEVQA